jgi:hypothetical protein
MSLFLEIEKAFLDRVYYLDDFSVREELLDQIIEEHPEIPAQQEIRIREFFRDVMTLAGLSHWAEKDH